MDKSQPASISPQDLVSLSIGAALGPIVIHVRGEPAFAIDRNAATMTRKA